MDKATTPLVIALCGMAGSGKSTASKFFVDKGFQHIHLGITEVTIAEFGKTTEELERKMRKQVREKHGMAAMAILSINKIREYLTAKHSVIIDNMYSWAEYKYFRQELGKSFYTVAIHANPELRYQRLLARKDDPNGRRYSKKEELISRDYSEIEEIEKGGPIAMADFHIVNEESTEALETQLEKIYQLL